MRWMPILTRSSLADNEVRKYYDENGKQFAVPEQAKAEFVVLSMETIGGQLAVSDAEIKSWYETHQDRFQQPEERRASHILIASEKIGKARGQSEGRRGAQGSSENP